MRIHRRIYGLRSSALVLGLVGAVVAALALIAPASAAGQSVQIQNFAFSPASITVQVGDTVTWTNRDSVTHTVTFDSGPDQPSSGNLPSGQSFSFTFTKPGSYTYMCSIHPSMRGSLTVQAASAPAAQATSAATPVPTATPAVAAATPTPTAAAAAATPVATAAATATQAAATAVAASPTPTAAALPRTGEPGVPLVPVALAGMLALGVGVVLRRRLAANRR